MAKCKIIRDSAGAFFGIRWWCPGCLYMDGSPMDVTLAVDWREVPGEPESVHQAGRPHWSFNGDFDKPVFGPSINSYWGGEYGVPKHICHSFIGINGAQPGQIIFLGDCTHALVGQVVDLPDVPEKKPWED
jgi:hypothetical protein